MMDSPSSQFYAGRTHTWLQVPRLRSLFHSLASEMEDDIAHRCMTKEQKPQTSDAVQPSVMAVT
jgi:hypothetical protein